MKEAIKVINELREKGLILDYAIGGGIATLFYIEPFLTYDLDVFIIVKPTGKNKIIDLTQLYHYLESRGYKWKGEHILIEGIPVQFIVADELEEEAIKNAKDIKYEDIWTKVFTPEYLIAILLRAGRRKDLEKVERLLEQSVVDKGKLDKILKKFKIKWRK